MTSYLNRLGALFNTRTSTSAGKNFCNSEPRRKDLSNKSEPSSLKSTPMSKSLSGTAKSFAREPKRYAIFTPYFRKICGSISGFIMVKPNISYIIVNVNGELRRILIPICRAGLNLPYKLAAGVIIIGIRFNITEPKEGVLK